jgi:hypothetical protein
MAHAEMPPETAARKIKRKKGHWKTRKEKSMAKRAAAAEKAQQSVMARDEMKATAAQSEMIQDEVAAQHDVEALSKVVNAEQHGAYVAPVAVNHAISFAVQGRPGCNYGTSVVALAEGESMVDNRIDFRDDFTKEFPKERTLAVDHALNTSCTAASDSRTTNIPHTQTQPPSNQPENASSSNLFTIQAHRKALETALYDNMESPMERLARLRFTKSASTEFHDIDHANEDLSSKIHHKKVVVPTKRASDTNGFAIIAMEAELPTSPPTSRSISIEELFSKAASESSSWIVGHSNAATSYTLAEVESL